ncbi:hypothetical protein PRIPAC_70980, partial [Pristionchus pacificus]
IFRLMADVGMDNDDASECSEELGMDYDRIEYPKEVYDLVCGRPTNEQPLAKKQKVDDWLQTSQSSQASSQLSQASSTNDVEASRGQKRKQKQTANRKKTADGARESVNNHRAKKDVKKVKNEVISDEETEERECHDDSSQVSSEAPKKKKKKHLRAKSSGTSSKSAKTKQKSANKIVKRKLKLRWRNVTMRMKVESEESSETDSEEEEESFDDGSESEEEWIGRSTRKTRPSSQSRGYFEDSDEEEEETIDSSPEKKKKKRSEDKSVNKDPVRVEKTEENNRSTNGKGKDDRTKKDTKVIDSMKKYEKPSSMDKWTEGKVKHDSKDARVRKESHSNGDERKESKEKDGRRMKESFESKEGRKSIDSTQVVLPKAKQDEKRPEITVAASSQSSVVHSSRKVKLKKNAPSSVNPSDNSMLPSCMQDIYSDLPCTPTNIFLDGFRVPKKKDKIEDRLTQRLGLPLTSPLADSPVQIEGSKGYDPRNDAFRPPQRNFKKPSLLKAPMGVEGRQHDIHRRPEDKSPSAIASAFYRPSLFQREDNRNYQGDLDDEEIDLEDIPIGAPPSIPLIPPTSPLRRQRDDEEEEEEQEQYQTYRSPVYFATTPSQEDSQEEHNGDWDERRGGHASPSYSMEETLTPPTYKFEFPTPRATSNERKRWDWNEEEERKHQVHHSSSSSSISTVRNYSSSSSFNFLGNFLDSSQNRSDNRTDFSRASAPVRLSFREQELVEERRQKEERRKEEERWKEGRRRKREEQEEAEEREREYWRMNTPLSPPPCSSSNRHHSLGEAPTLIPVDKLVQYRFIPIDDLPPLPSDQSPSSPFAYAPSAPKRHALLVVGPFPDRVSKPKFEKMMKEKSADVEWTVAPASKDVHAMTQRSMAAVICYSEETVKELLDKHNIMIDQTFVEVGKPGEVLVSVEGYTDKVDEEELTMEITDTVETHWGHLIELLLTVNQEALTVHGKARFFYAIHASRASCAAPIPMSGGRLLSFAPCPPEQSTPWIKDSHCDSTEEPAHHGPRPVPPPPILPHAASTVSSSTMAYVPPPDTAPTLAALSAVLRGAFTTHSDMLPQSRPTTTVSTSMQSQNSAVVAQPAAPPLSGSHISRFSAVRPLMSIPPPGLIDAEQLKYMIKREEPDDYERALSIGPIPIRAALIPLPPPPPLPIPPPLDIKPVLPYPDLPSVDRVFFQPPPPPGVMSRSGKERREGGREASGKCFNTATYLNHVKELLPKPDEEEILLFARPLDGEQPPDWDVVRDYFKDEDCSSLVYGGIISLRFTGVRAKEKAQLLLCKEDGTPYVNGQQFEVGVTFAVLFEATSAVRKIGVYDQVKERFGSVVEVEKKCNTPLGKPVYKIYFDSLETAKQAGLEGFTAEGSTFTNIGPLPE